MDGVCWERGGKVIRDPKLLWTSTDDPWIGCAREHSGKVIRDPKLLWTSIDDPWIGYAREHSGKVIRDPKLLWTSTDDPWMGCAGSVVCWVSHPTLPPLPGHPVEAHASAQEQYKNYRNAHTLNYYIICFLSSY